jgi:hypothetical protein
METRENNIDDDCPGDTDVNDDDSAVLDSSDIRSPLLSRDPRNYLRQRSTRTVDIESTSLATATDDSRILDRNGAFRQSRGRWSVHRESSLRNAATTRWWRWRGTGCFQSNEWKNLGGWFHRLAYQPTGVLMLILFLIYTSIVALFAGIYLTVSVVGQTTESNPDGSEKHIPFCHMEINNRMEALYMSLSTMAAIGYGGEWIVWISTWPSVSF